jgi:hypothetical protein
MHVRLPFINDWKDKQAQFLEVRHRSHFCEGKYVGFAYIKGNYGER